MAYYNEPWNWSSDDQLVSIRSVVSRRERSTSSSGRWIRKMDIFNCPCCSEKSVVWDSRAKVFLCRNRHCATAFPPLRTGSPIEDKKMILLLGWNSVDRDRIEAWLSSAPHSVHEDEGRHCAEQKSASIPSSCIS